MQITTTLFDAGCGRQNRGRCSDTGRPNCCCYSVGNSTVVRSSQDSRKWSVVGWQTSAL